MVKIILFLRVLYVYASNTSGKVFLRHIKYELYFFLNLVPTHYRILKLVELMTLFFIFLNASIISLILY